MEPSGVFSYLLYYFKDFYAFATEHRGSHLTSAGSWIMFVNKRDVVRIVKAGASDEAQKNALLALAGDKPSLWDGLDEEDVLGVLKQAITQLETGVIDQSITTRPGLQLGCEIPALQRLAYFIACYWCTCYHQWRLCMLICLWCLTASVCCQCSL